jgi:ribosomal-protein-alanine N-acetyltransferase
MIFHPFPELTTERLTLRRINASDAEVILYLRSDETINKFIKRPESSKTKNLDDALKFIKRIDDGLGIGNFISWGITMTGDQTIVGTICLWNFSEDRKAAEVGYDMNPLFQGKGIMSEALQSVLSFGFEVLSLDKIVAFTQKNNEPSKKLLERNGLVLMPDRIDEGNSLNLTFKIEAS